MFGDAGSLICDNHRPLIELEGRKVYKYTAAPPPTGTPPTESQTDTETNSSGGEPPPITTTEAPPDSSEVGVLGAAGPPTTAGPPKNNKLINDIKVLATVATLVKTLVPTVAASTVKKKTQTAPTETSESLVADGVEVPSIYRKSPIYRV